MKLPTLTQLLPDGPGRLYIYWRRGEREYGCLLRRGVAAHTVTAWASGKPTRKLRDGPLRAHIRSQSEWLFCAAWLALPHH